MKTLRQLTKDAGKAHIAPVQSVQDVKTGGGIKVNGERASRDSSCGEGVGRIMAEHAVDPDRAGHLREGEAGRVKRTDTSATALVALIASSKAPPEVATSVTNSIFAQHDENDELGRR